MRKLDGKLQQAERQVPVKAAAPQQAVLEPGVSETPAPEPAQPAQPAPAQPAPAQPAPAQPAPAQPAQRPKRKKTSLDVDHTFGVVEQALKRNPKDAGRDHTVPPIMHTPQSLFRMLCDVFEQEFPHRLPPQAVEHMLQALHQEA